MSIKTHNPSSIQKNDHVHYMKNGKLMKQKIQYHLKNHDHSKIIKYLKELDHISLTKIYVKLIANIEYKTSSHSMVKAFVTSITKNIKFKLLVDNKAIVMLILNNLQSSLQNNFIRDSPLQCKLIRNLYNIPYEKYEYNISDHWDGKIPCGCPTTSKKCKGIMETRLKNLNRCISCSPYAYIPTKGFSCKTMYASSKIYNRIKDGDKNPRLGICSKCIIENIVLKNSLNNKLNNESNNNKTIILFTILKFLYYRSFILIDLNDFNEIDLSILNNWPGRIEHNAYKSGLLGDDKATKIWPFLKHIKKLCNQLNEEYSKTAPNSINVYKFIYEVDIEFDIESDIEYKMELDYQSYQDVKMDNEQWINNNDESGFISDDEIDINVTNGIICDKYSTYSGRREWYLKDKNQNSIQQKCWLDNDLSNSSNFNDYNKKHHENWLTSDVYDPLKDAQLLNNAYPCIDFTTKTTNHLKEYCQKINQNQSSSFHVLVIVSKFIPSQKTLSLFIIDVNEGDRMVTKKIKNKFFQDFHKTKAKLWNKIDYNFVYLDINNSTWTDFYKRNLDKRIKIKGFCDTLSTFIMKEVYDYFNKFTWQQRHHMDLNTFKISLNKLLNDNILNPLIKLRQIDLSLSNDQ